MAKDLPIPTWRAELTWSRDRKQWLLLTVRQRANGVEARRRWIDTEEPVDMIAGRGLERAILVEMLSWLPLHEGGPTD